VKDWITDLYRRWLHLRIENHAGDIERQIREQLEQQYSNKLNQLEYSLMIADQGVDIYRRTLQEKEALINELKAKQSLTQKPKTVKRRKPSRKGK